VIYLDEPSLGQLPLDNPDYGIVVSDVDFGFPAVRAVITNRPGSDGALDDSQFHGSRVVSVTGSVYDGTSFTRPQLLDRFAAYCHPSRRPTLVWSDSGQDLRYATLRVDQHSGPRSNPSLTKIQAQWTVPDGVVRSLAERSVDLEPSQAAPGRSFATWNANPLTFPSFIGGPGDALNLGSTWSDWRALVYGPCVGPAITNVSTGATISFSGLTIAAGDYLDVNTATHTAILNSVPGSSRYSFLDFATSSWWRLPPGDSSVTFTAGSSQVPSSCHFVWHDTFL
jgi:hypothetical protein